MSADSVQPEDQRGHTNSSVNSFAGDPSLLRVRNFVENNESPPPDPLNWILDNNNFSDALLAPLFLGLQKSVRKVVIV